MQELLLAKLSKVLHYTAWNTILARLEVMLPLIPALHLVYLDKLRISFLNNLSKTGSLAAITLHIIETTKQ